MQKQAFKIEINTDNESESPVSLLASATGQSKQVIKDAMHKGAAWLTRGKHTRRIRRHKAPLKDGDTLYLYFNKDVLQSQVVPPTLVADERHYSVWNKPSGMLSQGSKWSDHTTIARWVETNLEPQRPAFVVHRLDRAANGLILIAHSKKSVQQLTALFQGREIEKRYRIVVRGKFPSTEAVSFEDKIDDKTAFSRAFLRAYDKTKNLSLLDVEIQTGRKHQIRRHLFMGGFPIVGDRLYGEDDEQDLQLAAVKLSFTCPFKKVKRTYRIKAALNWKSAK